MVRNIPGKPLVNRWGYVSYMEKYIRKIGRERLQAAWPRAMLSKATKKKARKKDDIGDLGDEEEDYSERQTRYASEANAGVQNPIF